MTASPSDDVAPGARAPLPLTMAALLTGVEALAFLTEGLALVPALESERLTMGLTSILFFLVYAAGLAFCAWQLHRLRSWARAPVVLAQLLQIMVGGSFWGGGTTLVSILLVTVAVATLVGIFHPASLRALEAADA